MLQDLIFSCNVVVPIFLLIMLGYALTRIKLWDTKFLEIANNLCFKCLLPVLLFYNVATANIFEVFNGKATEEANKKINIYDFCKLFFAHFFNIFSMSNASCINRAKTTQYLDFMSI